MEIKTTNNIIKDSYKMLYMNDEYNNIKWICVDDIRKRLLEIENIIFDNEHDDAIIKLINELSSK